MNRLSFRMLAVLALMLPGCGLEEMPHQRAAVEPAAATIEEDQPPAAAAFPTVALTEPWTRMGLPTDSGHVVVSDATTVSVAHDGSSVAALLAAYGDAVAAQGWSVLGQESSASQATVIFEREDKRMGLGLQEENGVTLVVLEDRTAVEANNAKVREAKPVEPAADAPDSFRRRRAPAKARGSKARETKARPRPRGKRKGGKVRR